METRRLVLAVVLTLAVILVWNYVWKPEPKPPAAPEAQRAGEPVKRGPAKKAIDQFIEEQRSSGESSRDVKLDPEAPATREVTVDTDLYRIVFTSDGGAIKSFRLRKYKDLPPDFITAKEKLLAKSAGDRTMHRSQKKESFAKMSSILADSRAAAYAGDALSDDEAKHLEEMTEEFYTTARKLSNADFIERRGAASRIRERAASRGSEENFDGDTRRRLELLEGVELVPSYLSEIGENALRTVYGDETTDGGKVFKTLPFRTTSPANVTVRSGSVSTIRFVASFNQGTGKLIKEYRIKPEGYAFDLSYRIEAASAGSIGLPAVETWLGPDIGSSGIEPKGRYSSGGIVASDGPNLLDEPFEFTDGLKWAALQDRYFIVSLANNVAWLLGSAPMLQGSELKWVLPIVPGASSSISVYAGPKAIDELKEQGGGLERVVDFGWLSVIAKPIYFLLKLFYSFLGNYGLAIIVLATLIKIVFYPLTLKQTQSMKKMQAVGPEIKRLKEKYKNDKETLNKETMALYKKHEVNPMGGCLPMLVQFPVLFALIRVLPIVIELRQSPFIFWLNDLSEPDPYYVTPILMGAAMVAQQKLAPSTADPKQSRMMMMMSVLFTWFFLSFSSGLVLYWFTGTLLQIVQQIVTDRWKRTKEAAGPPAKANG
ncbi:membrane protein insertase YidC [bacterium]|nr:membrane protein insertase YidC [bacterium]